MAQIRSIGRAVLFSSAASAALCAGTSAIGQTTAGNAPENEETVASPAAQPAEAIVVTGSRIRGVAPVGSGVIAVGRDDITVTSAVSTSEVFRNIPQVVNVGIQESNRGAQGGAGNITYASSVNLRGIGPFATLTLIDGHRVVGGGTQGLFVDPSIIPITALQRVEVVADGASAIYGSDAVAGVVNLILRRNLDGVDVNARMGFADNYTTRQLGAAVGKVWDTGQIMLSGEYSYHSALNGTDRSYIRSDLRAFGGPDFRSTNCNPGTIVVGGVNYAIPAGGVTPANRDALIPGTINRCEVGGYADVIPEIEKIGAVVTFRQELSPTITLEADGFYYRREFLRQAEVPAQALTVPNTNAFFVAPPGTNPPRVTVNYFFGNDFGNTFGYDGSSEAYQGTVGLDIKLSPEWTFEAGISHGHNEDIAYNYGPNPGALAAALASSNPATAFNPFGGANSPAVIAAIGNYVRLAAPGENDLLQAQAKIDGPLFALPGGDVSVAVGGEYVKIDVTAGSRTGPIGALTGSDASFSRNVKSAYAELFIPIFGADNETPGFRRLVLNLAGRYDSYNDVGETWNPKIGLNWEPVDGLKFRGNWGTSFRAPPLTSLVSINASLSGQNYSDPLSPTGFSAGYAINEGNIDLKPEEATTWSVGVDFTPPSLPGFNASVTYFNVDYRGQITSLLGDLNVLQREELYPGLIIRNPSAQQVADLLARLPVRGVPLSQVDVLIDARPNNLGVSKIDGIDFSVNYQLETDSAGTFGFGLNGIWYSRYKVAQSANAPLIERVGYINFPTKYNLRGNVNWRKDWFSANMFVNHVPSYENNSINPSERIDAWTTVDLNLAFDVPQVENSWYRGMTFSINVQNLFDRDPPYASLPPNVIQSGGFDIQQSNPLGRLITAGVSLKF
jgi:Outer membrane cobalamin receptor protein